MLFASRHQAGDLGTRLDRELISQLLIPLSPGGFVAFNAGGLRGGLTRLFGSFGSSSFFEKVF